MTPPHYRARLAVGGVLTALGITWTIVSTAFVFQKDMRAGAPANFALALGLLLLPGLVLYLTGRARRARIERSEAVASVATATGRVPVVRIAETVGMPAGVARRALLDAVAWGRLSGRLDVARDEFVTAAVGGGAPRETSVVCSRCGATSTAVVAPGEPAACGYCGGTAVAAG